MQPPGGLPGGSPARDKDVADAARERSRSGDGPPGEDPPANMVRARLELTVQDLDLEVPPGHIHLNVLSLRTGTRVLAWSPDLDREHLHRWLTASWPVPDDTISSGQRSVINVELGESPKVLAVLQDHLDVLHLVVAQDGTVEVYVQEPRSRVLELKQALDAAGARARIGSLQTDPIPERQRLLTEKQEGAMVAALRAGYYEVPREIHLEDLATQLGMSKAALSERLRRAEQRLVKAYLDPSTTMAIEGISPRDRGEGAEPGA